jgi:hypothetical protein
VYLPAHSGSALGPGTRSLRSLCAGLTIIKSFGFEVTHIFTVLVADYFIIDIVFTLV